MKRNPHWIWITGISTILLGALLPYLRRFPIYTDEVGYKIIFARYWADQGKATTLFPQCSPSFDNSHPILFTPFRIFESFLYGNLENPQILRDIGILNGFLSALLLCAVVWVLLKGSSNQKTITALFFPAFYFIGLGPFLYSVNRPEQLIVLSLFTMTLVGLTLNTYQLPAKLKTALYVLFSLMMIAAFSVHAKTLFLIPLILALIFSFFQSKAMRLIQLSVMTLSAVQCFSFFSKASNCPDNPWVTYMFSFVFLSPQHILVSPIHTLLRGAKGLKDIGLYFKVLFFKTTYRDEWFQGLPNLGFADVPLNKLILILFLLSLIFLVAVIWMNRNRRNSNLFALVGCLLGLFTFSFFNIGRAFYESILFLPFLFLSFALTIPLGFERKIKNFGITLLILAFFIGAGSVLNSIRIASVHKSSGLWSTPGMLPGPFPSFNAIDFQNETKKVRSLAESCALPKNPKHLVTDQLRYPMIPNQSEPFQVSYITGFWGKRIKSLPKLLSAWGSPGILVHCSNFPKEFDSGHIQNGDYCCKKFTFNLQGND